METSVQRIPKRRWLILLPTILLLQLVSLMDRLCLGMAFAGGMRDDLMISATLMGVVTGIVFVGMFVLNIPGGWAVTKGKARSLLLICSFAWSCFTVLTGFVQNEIQLILVRFLLGVSEGCIMPAIQTIMSYWFPDSTGERAQANSVFMMTNSVGGIVMSPLSGAILNAFTWHHLFWVFGCISFASFLLFFAFGQDRPEKARWLSQAEKDYIVSTIEKDYEQLDQRRKQMKAEGKRASGPLWTNGFFWIAVVVMPVALGWATSSLSSWSPTIIRELTKAGITTVGWLNAVPSACSLVTLLIAARVVPHVADRRVSAFVPAAASGAAMFVTALGVMNGWVITAFVGIIFVFGLVPTIHSSFMTFANLLFDRGHEGTLRGVQGLTQALGGFLGPYLIGALHNVTDSAAAGLILMGVLMIVIFSLAFALPKQLLLRDVKRT